MKDISRVGQIVSARHRFLMELAGELQGKDVLDLGCSFGWFEKHAVLMKSSRIVGLDLDVAQVERARDEVPEAELYVRDATGPLSDLGCFDVVCAFDVTEHLPKGSETGFMKEAAGVLKPDGRLLLSVPYRSFLSCVLDPAFYFGHRHYRFRDAEKLLSGAGFEVSAKAFGGGLWWMLSMIWLYIFKWVFRREMPFYELLERKRTAEHERLAGTPGIRSFATMFIEAHPRRLFEVSRI